ncbi:hypothetical protein BIU82_07295 [Arthrobacter sp. SW1]|uniref:hypothetical protein n=1 Tax=Arthrobacter sp. SW1 TaxID=1920889 RepID=UPI000877BD59|nr:hypothetical protein [Arthrobacter sp. SW1]OFI37674.1 hypothetical protein BIU82_07295 [Arthrobacter sp. SW1]
MHKYSAQTARKPLAQTDAALLAEAAEVEAIVKETPTPAEHVVDHLQEACGAESQLSPEQVRAERVAALVRKVRENRAKSAAPTSGEGRGRGTVNEALEKIRARRAEEQTRRGERRTEDNSGQRQDRAPGYRR